MKMLIDIDEDVYRWIKSNEQIIRMIHENDRGSQGLEAKFSILNGKVLSGSSNGEVIQTVFPHIDASRDDKIDIVEVRNLERPNTYTCSIITEFWDGMYDKKPNLDDIELIKTMEE